MAKRITIDGVVYVIRADKSVSAPPTANSANPFERQWWWATHPWAQYVRRQWRKRRG